MCEVREDRGRQDDEQRRQESFAGGDGPEIFEPQIRRIGPAVRIASGDGRVCVPKMGPRRVHQSWEQEGRDRISVGGCETGMRRPYEMCTEQAEELRRSDDLEVS